MCRCGKLAAPYKHKDILCIRLIHCDFIRAMRRASATLRAVGVNRIPIVTVGNCNKVMPNVPEAKLREFDHET